MQDSELSNFTVIIPCANPVEVHNAQRPKWLLTTPSGELLVVRAGSTVPRPHVRRTIIILLQEIEDRFSVCTSLARAFPYEVEFILLERPTVGPAETVREAIRRADVRGAICIKDSDSFFSLEENLPAGSFLAVADVRSMSSVSELGRKSFVVLNEQNLITDIVEKNVVSNLISVGLYGFSDAQVFSDEFDHLRQTTGLVPRFVSHIIESSINNGRIFQPIQVSNFVDINTRGDWHLYRANYASFIIDIDGVIFRNQSAFFSPYWGDPVDPIEANIAHLRLLQARGAQLIFMTARPEKYRESTTLALETNGLSVYALVMGCLHGTRYLVNDYAPSNPFPSAVAINLRRNMDDLPNLLSEELFVRDREL